MKLNQSKCILLGMNSLGSVQYLDGGYMPVADRAPYLYHHPLAVTTSPHLTQQCRIKIAAEQRKRECRWF